MMYNPYTYAMQPNPNAGIQPAQQQQNLQTNSYQQSYFLGVPNEQTARMYPVAPGNSITFRDESDPCRFYTKTMGPSPLDRPYFEIYRLIREDIAEAAAAPSKSTDEGKKESAIDLSAYALKTEVDALKEQIEALQKELAIKEKAKKENCKGTGG